MPRISARKTDLANYVATLLEQLAKLSAPLNDEDLKMTIRISTALARMHERRRDPETDLTPPADRQLH